MKTAGGSAILAEDSTRTAARASRFSYAGPIDVLPADKDPLPAAWVTRLFWIFLALGIAARCLRYFLRFPLWEDECFLCLNFIDRGYLDVITKSLYCHQTAPPLFLSAEFFAARLLGFSELTLRLVPFVASIGALALFAHIARRLLKGTALIVAVAFMAVSYPGIRYAAEAKQYGTDLFVAVALIAMAGEWWRASDRTLWLWLLAAFAPLAIGLSLPSIFVVGGVCTFAGAVLLAEKRWRAIVPVVVFMLAAAASLAAVCLLSRAQSQAELAYMRQFWHKAFPPSLTHPLELAKWLLATYTGELLAIPAGSAKGGSIFTFILCLGGLAAIVKQRLWPLVLLALVPAALQLAAASQWLYPYGGAVKFSQPLAAFICILAGCGAAYLLNLLAARPRVQLPAAAVLCIALAAVGIGSIARDIAFPYKTLSDQRSRAFAQWFWFSGSYEGQVADSWQDFRLNLQPDMFKELTWGPMYYCNERIYRPASRRTINPDLVTSKKPLRVAVYRADRLAFDQVALDSWLSEMRGQYDLLGQETYPVPRMDKRERKLVALEHIDIFSFGPKS